VARPYRVAEMDIIFGQGISSVVRAERLPSPRLVDRVSRNGCPAQQPSKNRRCKGRTSTTQRLIHLHQRQRGHSLRWRRVLYVASLIWAFCTQRTCEEIYRNDKKYEVLDLSAVYPFRARALLAD
jgi:hypothetical protein